MDKRETKKNKYIITGIITIFISIFALMLLFNFPKSLEHMAEDKLYQNPGAIPSDIKIIAIDEETLSKLGPYSDWNRAYFADLIELLNSDKSKSPRVIGIDIVFSGTNNSEDDARLVEVCRESDNIVMASSANFDSYYYKDNDGTYHSAQYISGEGKPFDELAEVVDYGFTTAIFDSDGFIRRTYTQVSYEYDEESVVYNAFAYLIASKLTDVKDYPVRVEPKFVSNPGEFEVISMIDVLDGTVSTKHFKDCIVLIGAYEEGMMDSYRVPIDYANEMYGVEIQANYVYAFMNDNIIYSVNKYLQILIVVVIVALFSIFAINSKIRNALIGMVIVIPGYVLLSFVLFEVTSYKLNVLTVPISVVLAFLASVIFNYMKMQKKRMYEMRDMLFSMAEAMAETIEGRTPYNANHTKNVAKRCIEMLDYINHMHREKKTDLHFTEDDKRQLYLAAMLHDVGKMDVPLEVMDKPTKLGDREKDLKYRLELIGLRIENDVLNGYISRDEADAKLEKIHRFMNNLDGFNCGRPLKENEWELVNEIADSVYVGQDGEELPYLTQEEIDDLHIVAGTLSENERNIMQSHVIYTDKILAHIQFGDQFQNVRAMAANHHELLNGKGYPKGINENELDIMTRILTIMDIYDSLIADDRPYKKPKSVKVAFEILDEEAEAGKIDKELLQIAKELYLTEDITKSDS